VEGGTPWLSLLWAAHTQTNWGTQTGERKKKVGGMRYGGTWLGERGAGARYLSVWKMVHDQREKKHTESPPVENEEGGAPARERFTEGEMDNQPINDQGADG